MVIPTALYLPPLHYRGPVSLHRYRPYSQRVFCREHPDEAGGSGLGCRPGSASSCRGRRPPARPSVAWSRESEGGPSREADHLPWGWASGFPQVARKRVRGSARDRHDLARGAGGGRGALARVEGGPQRSISVAVAFSGPAFLLKTATSTMVLALAPPRWGPGRSAFASRSWPHWITKACPKGKVLRHDGRKLFLSAGGRVKRFAAPRRGPRWMCWWSHWVFRSAGAPATALLWPRLFGQPQYEGSIVFSGLDRDGACYGSRSRPPPRSKQRTFGWLELRHLGISMC